MRLVRSFFRWWFMTDVREEIARLAPLADELTRRAESKNGEASPSGQMDIHKHQEPREKWWREENLCNHWGYSYQDAEGILRCSNCNDEPITPPSGQSDLPKQYDWTMHRVYVRDGELKICSGSCSGYRGGMWFKVADFDPQFINCPACRIEIPDLPEMHGDLRLFRS